MANDKVPPEYGDSGLDRPPPYNPYYGDQPGPSPSGPGFVPSNQQQYPNLPEFTKSPPPPVQGPPSQTHPQGSSVVIFTQPSATVTSIPMHSGEFGPYPQHLVCPKCQQYVITKTKWVAGCKTWLACLGLMMCGCDGCCCLIPCCMDSCRDVIHRCPNCNRKVGRFKRMC